MVSYKAELAVMACTTARLVQSFARLANKLVLYFVSVLVALDDEIV